MNSLLAGIFMFFGIHSISIFAPQLRDKLAAKNEYGWKAIYAVISVAGIVFITQGYAELKLSPTLLYVTPRRRVCPRLQVLLQRRKPRADRRQARSR